VSSTLLTVAKDVKIQVEFNSNKVASYRLIGYENRLLRREDFNDEKVDAGEIGAGQTLTALYEIVPVGLNGSGPAAESPLDELRYVTSDAFSSRLAMPGTMDPARARELLNVTVRYKKPDGLFPITRSQEFPVVDGGAKFAEASPDFRFAAAVAEFGMILRDSPHKGAGSLGDVLAWAANAATKPADDPGGYRGEFIDLVRKAQVLMQ
jgi:Ca-activated chloride channel family protein